MEGILDYKKLVIEDIKKRKLTVESYAKLLGIIPDTVYRWKRGDLQPSKRCLLLMQFSNDRLEDAHKSLEAMIDD